MTIQFNQDSKIVADEIIAISLVLKDRMQSWADVFVRIPDSQNVDVTAGFITDWTRPNVIEVLVEVQAPKDSTTALARIQAIETIKDDAGNESFNQVSLHYTVDYARARQLVEKGGNTTREDIAELMHAEASKLARVIVSDETGKDEKTGQLFGKRYDFDANELATITEEAQNEITEAISKVLPKLKQTAAHEAKAI